jgi:glycosyltransferase involved in cell wall biosynthesis
MIDIAVSIPSYNGEKYIDTAIESVKAQTIPNVPIYIFDDHSRDATVQLCRRYSGVTVFENSENMGLARNLRNCFYHPPHTHIALLLQDDWFDPQHIERAVDAFNRQADIRYYFCHARLIYEDQRVGSILGLPAQLDGYIEESQLYHLFLKGHVAPVSSTVVDRKVLTVVPESCWQNRCADWEFIMHVSNHFRGWAGEETNVNFLQRQNSLGQNWYKDIGYLEDRVRLLLRMHEHSKIPSVVLQTLLRRRWLEAMLISLYRVENKIDKRSVIAEMSKVHSMVQVNMPGNIAREHMMNTCFSILVWLIMQNWTGTRRLLIAISRRIGLGRFLMSPS